MPFRRLLVTAFFTGACSCAVCAAGSDTFTLWQLPNQTPTQMMSYVLKTVNDEVMVIDGGNAGDAAYLAAFIEKLGNQVAAWFISHPHEDHYDALREILKAPGTLTIGALYASMPTPLWMQEHTSDSEQASYAAFHKALSASPYSISELTLGQHILIDGVTIEILGIKNSEILANPVNNSSVVMRVSDQKKAILFTGDLGVEGGEKLLRGPYADRLPAAYVQMAHHGQNGVSEVFYAQVKPAYCLWPTPKWLWENDSGKGKGSGPWRTLEVRAWMEKHPIKKHYVMCDGLQKIE